mmetsp:Transcript_11934/g.15861  ORF Transcript_11934/g.15861 Transcript_11934/m.15861 type:complete len:126 (+) Transcript_11934:2-379(+)
MLSWRPFNEWIFKRVNSHTYRSSAIRISGARERVNPQHPRAPMWPHYAGNNLMLSCLRSGSQLIRVHLFDAPKTSEEDLTQVFLESAKQRQKMEDETSVLMANLKGTQEVSSERKFEPLPHKMRI